MDATPRDALRRSPRRLSDLSSAGIRLPATFSQAVEPKRFRSWLLGCGQVHGPARDHCVVRRASKSRSGCCLVHGVRRSWVHRLKARYEAQGEAAFEPRSRRPHTSPRATPPAVVELILTLRKQLFEGPGCRGRHHRLASGAHHQFTVSRATVHRVLVRQGAVTPTPEKRPKGSYLRFEASLPDECWQSTSRITA